MLVLITEEKLNLEEAIREVQGSPPSAAPSQSLGTKGAPEARDELRGTLGPSETGPRQQFGALATFAGCVRDSENGCPIVSIRYEAYKTMAQKRIQRIVDAAFELWGARIAIHHRIGNVPVGETSVVIACAAKHRKEAFGACQYAIEEIKTHVPIWKVDFQEAQTCA